MEPTYCSKPSFVLFPSSEDLSGKDKAKKPKAAQNNHLACSKTSYHIKTKLVNHCYVISKVTHLSNKTLHLFIILVIS